MEITKELKDISLQISEPQYRQRPELSYSTLSTYERIGFNNLDHLFDKKDTPSLTHGSMVDEMITGSAESFNDRFLVLDVEVTDSGKAICQALINKHLNYEDFIQIPEFIVSNVAKETEFWKADKWDRIRYKKVMETGNIAQLYNAMYHADKTIVSTKDYQQAVACVRALRESPATCRYFADNDPLSPVRRYYQLKFAARFEGVGYRCMMDLVLVDYEHKIIYPCDLKTSSHTEWDFQDSFKSWSYMIQGMLYWRILKANMMKDPYFKDFTLADYRFIVINKYTLTPLVWEFPLTKCRGTLVDSNGKEYRDPFVIGKELRGYLNSRPRVPNGINIDGINVIDCLKLKE